VHDQYPVFQKYPFFFFLMPGSNDPIPILK
jgi:hypothetical protein